MARAPISGFLARLLARATGRTPIGQTPRVEWQTKSAARLRPRSTWASRRDRKTPADNGEEEQQNEHPQRGRQPERFRKRQRVPERCDVHGRPQRHPCEMKQHADRKRQLAETSSRIKELRALESSLKKMLEACGGADAASCALIGSLFADQEATSLPPCCASTHRVRAKAVVHGARARTGPRAR